MLTLTKQALREASILFKTALTEEEAAQPVEQTYAMIKPDATGAGHADEICLLAENHGFTIVKKEQTEGPLDAELVKEFYGKPMPALQRKTTLVILYLNRRTC